MVRFRCIRSNGNARKRHETGNGNTGYPSCFRNGLTCFYHVSVYGFLQFRPVYSIMHKILLNVITTFKRASTSPPSLLPPNPYHHSYQISEHNVYWIEFLRWKQKKEAHRWNYSEFISCWTVTSREYLRVLVLKPALCSILWLYYGQNYAGIIYLILLLSSVTQYALMEKRKHNAW